MTWPLCQRLSDCGTLGGRRRSCSRRRGACRRPRRRAAPARSSGPGWRRRPGRGRPGTSSRRRGRSRSSRPPSRARVSSGGVFGKRQRERARRRLDGGARAARASSAAPASASRLPVERAGSPARRAAARRRVVEPRGTSHAQRARERRAGAARSTWTARGSATVTRGVEREAEAARPEGERVVVERAPARPACRARARHARAEHVAHRARERELQLLRRRRARRPGLGETSSLRVGLRREPRHAHRRREVLPRARRRRDDDRADGRASPLAAFPTGTPAADARAGDRLARAEPDEADGLVEGDRDRRSGSTWSQRPRRCAVGVSIVKRRVSVLADEPAGVRRPLDVSATVSRSPAGSVPTGHSWPSRTRPAPRPGRRAHLTARGSPEPRQVHVRERVVVGRARRAARRRAATPTPDGHRRDHPDDEIHTRPHSRTTPFAVRVPWTLLARAGAALPGRPLP